MMGSPPRPLPTTLRSPPSLDDYTPLAEHQSATPASFYDGKPILHYHATGATARLPESQRRQLPIFQNDDAVIASDSAAPGGTEAQLEQKVDIFVTSETLTLFAPSSSTGVSIPYPLIGIHAIQTLPPSSPSSPPTQAVYMQLDLSDGGADDETYDTLDLTLSPSPAAETPRLFAAVSACAALHPDLPDDDGGGSDDADERIVLGGDREPQQEALEGFTGVYRGAGDGGLPPPMPGSGGWITAENVHEHFDADGNWIGGGDEEQEEGEEEQGVSGELGEGAGRVRGREESGEVNGHGSGGEGEGESKRVRTE